jgi:hypothetical protein
MKRANSDPLWFRTTVYLSDADNANLEKLCQTLSRKKSTIFRNLLREEINHLKNGI